MVKSLVRRFGWLTSTLIFSMPIFLVMFLGAMMARGQVKGEFDRYQAIQEYTSLASLASVADDEVVMVHGRIVEGPSPEWADGLVVFQERPLENRETRFQEQFPLVFPELSLELSDGTMLVQPAEERVIAHELHRVADEGQDREYTGFRLGDTVNVQGKWQKSASGNQAVLSAVTGISSLNRAAIIAEGEWAFRRLDNICLVLGGLTVISIVLLIIQFLRGRAEERIAAPVSV